MAQSNPDRRNKDRRLIARICTCDRTELALLIRELLTLLTRALMRLRR